jgi:hypothetical protein
MPKHRPVFYPLLLAVLLSACQPKPAIVNHPAPQTAMDFRAFVEAGCPQSESGGDRCPIEKFLTDFGCNQIVQPANELGNLLPSYPIAICEVQPYASNSVVGQDYVAGQDYFYNSGGLFPTYIRYIIFRDNQFELVRNEDELRAVYAPIETPEEALSFVLAARSLSASYGLERDPGYTYEIDTLEDTHVEATNAGYLLHLYDYQVFGCGPHWTYIVQTEVTKEGVITEVDRQQAFRDPTLDNLCVD